MSDNAEWLRVWHIVERYLSDVDVLDPAELTNLIVPTKCSNKNCTHTPMWYSILDESVFCNNCAEPIGSYVRPINAK